MSLGPALVRFTGCAEGDLAATASPTDVTASGTDVTASGTDVTASGRDVTSSGTDVTASGRDRAVEMRRRAILDRPWTVLHQVHGARVVIVTGPGDQAGERADGAVSTVAGVGLAVLTADCAPVALASPEGVIGVAHAGWRGLLGGVIPETVAAMRALGATRVVAALGPCIHPECYPFGSDEIDRIAVELGPLVRSSTPAGGPALDLPAAVRASLQIAGAQLTVDAAACTACSGGYWSWRAGRRPERQATVVWLP